ncbi:MAG: glycosyltransferase family 39 protein [Chloroflexota bacterium]
MKPHKPSARIQAGLYFGMCAVLGIAALVWTAAIPADEKGSVLWGFSLARLVLLGGILILSLLAGLAGWFSFRRPELTERLLIRLGEGKNRLKTQRVSAILMGMGWLASFMPAYWFKIYQFYFVRLQPLLVWLGTAGLLAFGMLTLPGLKERFQRWKDDSKNFTPLIRAAGITLGVFAGVWLIAALTGLGIVSEPYFWDEASVPLLGLQVALCGLAVVIINRFVLSAAGFKNSRTAGWILFISIWLFSFFLWYVTPLKHSYFAPGPRPPNYLFYPYSDAEFYDLSAQYILIGQGVFNGIPMDKPLYSMFLALIHALVGQGYEETVNLQIFVLAAMPAVLYLLGSQMANRPAGLLMALLAAFHQRNAIAATPFIKVSHSKLLLTEYPTALLLVIFALFAFKWLRNQSSTGLREAVLAGGFLGLAVLVRPNAMMVLPFVLFTAWVANRRILKPRLLASGVIIAMLIVTILPFMLEIPKGFNEPYLVIKIRNILESRILTDEPRGVIPLENQIAAGDDFLSWTNKNRFFVESLFEGLERFAYVPRHFFHNLIMTVMLLPNTFALHDLSHTLEAPYWADVRQWKGELPAGAALLLPLNLMILALGVGAAWQRQREAGLVPLMMLPGYFLANSLARNSGWRYLVPMDWVVLFYFAIGALVLLRWVLDWLGIDPHRKWQPQLSGEVNPAEQALRRREGLATPLLGLVFLLVGLSLPLNKDLIPDRYPPLSPVTLYEKVNSAGLRIDKETFKGFMKSPNAYLNYGVGLYPRFYPANGGEPQTNLPLKGRPYPRFTLTVVGWDTFYTVLLPMEESMASFPHGEDVIVMGCKDTQEPFIDAYAVVVLSDPPQVFQRSGETSLTCPFAPIAAQP